MTKEKAIKWLKVEASYIEEDVGHGKEILEAYDMAIEALEQEPCDDAISRQAAEALFRNARKELMKQDRKEHIKDFNTRDLMLLNAEQFIHLLPSVTPQPRWIPCSEGLPKELEPVNITWVNHNPESYYSSIKDKPLTATGHYCNGRWWWYSVTCQDYLAEYGRCDVDAMDDDIEVIAWMPLPEPYRGGESDAK